jgi:ABC-type branched-subunit amino acid transport system substrate-binding protein
MAEQEGGIKISGQQYDVELLVEDNKNTADGSAAAATKLVHRDKVRFVTGMIVPFQINAVETITEPAGVILASGKAAYLNPNSRLSFSATASIVAPLPRLYEALTKWYPEVRTVAFTAHDEAGAQAVLKAARDRPGPRAQTARSDSDDFWDKGLLSYLDKSPKRQTRCSGRGGWLF